MTWWGWMIIGAVLLGAELFAVEAQFYLVFLGISAALVDLAGLLGVTLPEWAQWLVFAALSLTFFFTFRRMLYEKVHGGGIGYKAPMAEGGITIAEDLPAGAETRSEYRGSKWTVRNVSDETIGAGSRAKVVKVDGLTLHVEAE